MTAPLARDGVPPMLGDVQGTVAEIDDLVAQRLCVEFPRERRRTALAAIGEVIHERVHALWWEKLTMSAASSLLSTALALAAVLLLRRPHPTSGRTRTITRRREVRVARVSAELGDQRFDLLLELGDLAITLGELGLEPLHLGDDPRVLLGADERHIEL